MQGAVFYITAASGEHAGLILVDCEVFGNWF